MSDDIIRDGSIGVVKGETTILGSFTIMHSSVEVKTSGGPLKIKLGIQCMNGWPQQKLPKFGFPAHTTALWPVEQFSILSAKFDCPVTHQKFSLLATVHDCETSL